MFLEVALCRKGKPRQKRQESRGVFLLLVDFRGTCCCVGLSPLTDGSGLFPRDLSLSTPAHTYTHPVWHVGGQPHTATPPPAARGVRCARPGAAACGALRPALHGPPFSVFPGGSAACGWRPQPLSTSGVCVHLPFDPTPEPASFQDYQVRFPLIFLGSPSWSSVFF